MGNLISAWFKNSNYFE